MCETTHKIGRIFSFTFVIFDILIVYNLSLKVYLDLFVIDF